MTASVESSSSSSSSVAGAASASSTASASAASSNSGGETMSTTIGSLAELKLKAPKVYNLMMVGIATTICNQMQHSQDRLKAAIRQGNSDAGYR